MMRLFLEKIVTERDWPLRCQVFKARSCQGQFSDHTEFRVLALQLYDVYGKSTLSFTSHQALASTRVALVSPTLASQWFLVLPGFAPAGEVAPWRVPKGAPVVVEAKGPKTIDAPSGLIGGDGRQLEKDGPTRSAHTWPAGG
ncbi:MAG: hypothetical protein VST67_06590 [Nitrospirota bacterium]|nr:hypothetical protein [Nitrospirota bacterium]